MGATHETTTTESNRPPDGEGPSKGELFEALSNDRRRETLRFLLQRPDGRSTKGEVARHIAACETDQPLEQVSSDERKRVYIALHQTHLPKLHEVGLVEYDSSKGELATTDACDGLDVYLDVVDEEGTSRPWSTYYLGLGLVGLAVTAVLAAGVLPGVSGPALAVTAAFAVAVTATGIVHAYEDDLPPAFPGERVRR